MQSEGESNVKKALLILLSVIMCLCPILALASCGEPEEAPPTADASDCEHTYGEWQQISAPTCAAGGQYSRFCSACGNEEKRTTAPSSHDFNNGSCSNCGKTLTILAEWDVSATDSDSVTAKLWQLSENNNLLEISGSGDMIDFKGWHPDPDILGEFTNDVPWTDYNESINHVRIGKDITHIGSYSFCATNITSFTFPNCESIENCDYPFLERCHNLLEIYFPSDFLEYYASNSGVEVPDGVTKDEIESGLKNIIVDLLRSSFGYDSNFLWETLISPRAHVGIDGWESYLWTDENGYVFLENGDICYLVNYEGAESALTLPESCHDKPYDLVDGLFYNDKSIKSVVIPEGIDKIYPLVFYYTELDSLTLPSTMRLIYDASYDSTLDELHVKDIDSLFKISHEGFAGCKLYIDGKQVTRIDVPENVKEIADYTFCGLSGITEIVLHPNITKIGDYAFAGTNITSITIPDSVTYLGENVFSYCSDLKSVKLGNGIKEFPESLFEACPDGVKIDLPDGNIRVSASLLGEVSSSAYEGDFLICDGWLINYSGTGGEVTLPSGVVGIAEGAMYSGRDITKLNLPEGLKYVYENASLYSLSEINIPSSLEYITTGAFLYAGYDDGLKVNISSLADWCEVEVGIGEQFRSNTIFDNATLFVNGNEVTELQIPDGVTKISPYVFADFTNITSLSVPTSVTSIGDYAFRGCTALTTATLPETEIEIGCYAFGEFGEETVWEGGIYCGTVGNPYFNLVGISDSAATELKVHKDTKIISIRAKECLNLTSIYFDSINSFFTSIKDATFNNVLNLYIAGVQVTDITIPEGIKTVPSSIEYFNLTSLTIPETVEKLESPGADSVERVYFPSFDVFSKLCNAFFYSDAKLYIGGEAVTNLIIPEGVTEIDVNAFISFSCIECITVPASLKTITDVLYGPNSSLSFVPYMRINISDIQSWCNVRFNSERKFEGFDLYLNGERIRHLVIPEGTTRINDFVFYGIVVESVTLPSTLEYLTTNSFSMYYGTIVELYNNSDFVIMPDCRFVGALNICNNTEDTKFTVTDDGFKFFKNDEYTLLTDYLGSETDIVLPDSFNGEKFIVTAYFFDRNITSLTISDGVEGINGNMYYCETIESIYVTDISQWLNINYGADLYSKDKPFSAKLYVGGKEVTDLVIPEGITEIEYGEFTFFDGIKSVTLPTSLQSISPNAFGENVTSVYITDLEAFCKVENGGYSGGQAFCCDSVALYLGDDEITDLTVPESVTDMIYNVIFDFSIESITLHENVNYFSIDKDAATFKSLKSITLYSTDYIYVIDDCPNLTDIYFYGTEQTWLSETENIVFANSPTVHYMETDE